MKSFAVTAALITLCVASTQAATPARKRSLTQRRSLNKASVESDESYDPYLGMEGRKLEKSMSMEHDAAADHSMSMGHSDSMSMGSTHHSGDGHSSHDGSVDTEEEGGSTRSSASYVGVTVSAVVAAGAMMLL